jgi:hypothetical protein
VVFAALLAAAANAAPCTTEFPARNLTQVLNAATRLNLVGALAKNTVFGECRSLVPFSPSSLASLVFSPLFCLFPDLASLGGRVSDFVIHE